MNSLLIADSDTWSIETTRQAAEQLGLEVSTAENGIEALERFRAERPRFVLIERMLPVADGLQVARRIRDTVSGQRTIVILMAAAVGSESSGLREQLQLTDVLEKPFTAQDLIRALTPFLALDASVGARADRTAEAVEACDAASNPPARILADLMAHGREGELVLRDGDLVRTLHLDRLSITAGSSNATRDTWPSWAARDPLLDPATRGRLAALAVPGPGDEGWARYLEDRGAFSAEEYAASRGRWLVDLAFDVITATSGQLEFHEGAPRPPAIGRVDARQLVFHGLRRAPGETFSRLLPDAGDLLAATPKRDVAGEFELTPLEHQILALIDGEHSLGDLESLARIVELDLRPFLYGCLALGLASAVRSEQVSAAELLSGLGESGLPPTGSLADVHAGRVLATLSFTGATGVLQLRRGEEIASIDVRAGRLIFARSNQAKYRIGNVLLRSGKIAPEDHGRAISLHSASRKHRLGYVLLQLGALSLKELHEGLCTQVRSIIGDVFSWTDGQYTFVAGQLPTSDAVSLDVSMANLLMRLFRSHTTRDVLDRYAPPAGARLVRLWDDAAVARWLHATDSERRILERATGEETLLEQLTQLEGEPSDLLASVVGLIGVGCIAPTRTEDADTTPVLQALARQSAGDSSGARELQTLTAHLGGDELRHVLAHLEGRVRTLEAENRRLRAQLAEKEEASVG